MGADGKTGSLEVAAWQWASWPGEDRVPWPWEHAAEVGRGVPGATACPQGSEPRPGPADGPPITPSAGQLASGTRHGCTPCRRFALCAGWRPCTSSPSKGAAKLRPPGSPCPMPPSGVSGGKDPTRPPPGEASSLTTRPTPCAKPSAAFPCHQTREKNTEQERQNPRQQGREPETPNEAIINVH